MDCGPASLKCLLEGFGIPASYGRLREACQTDVDGTSIDVIEEAARKLGLDAQQIMIPVDHVFLDEADALPAMIVTRAPDGATHFVVAWRRHGKFLQIMDPATGRRWVDCRRFAEDIYRHRFEVPAAAWREWAASEDFLAPLRRRLASLGLKPAGVRGFLERALNEPDWYPLATLDAATRLAESLVRARGLRPGTGASGFLQTLLDEAGRAEPGGCREIPESYWSAWPAGSGPDEAANIVLRGAVLVRVRGRRTAAADDSAEPLSPELASALTEERARPGRELLNLLRADGLLAPLALIGAMALGVGAVLVETLLFRGLFDLGRELELASQRLGALAGLEVFLALILLVELAIAKEALRLGRHLEIRLRMALLRKLPLLGDRYFHSRPISDMADRSHALYLTRQVPELGVHLIESAWDLLFTLAGIALVDPASAPWAIAIVAVAVGVPWLAQPFLNERDLRVRSHAGALAGFYLDALLGLVAVRTHGAESAVRGEHEALLAEWARAGRGLARISLLAQAIQAVACLALGAGLLWQHFQRVGITGGVLLLVYWTLKLPAIGQRLILLSRQYPAQRNILLRLLEPLAAPEEAAPGEVGAAPSSGTGPVASADSSATPAGVSIAIDGGAVLASGHTILRDIDLAIAPGEHVAIVGPSGAGKSSLLGLLLGWHRLSEGTLAVDGEPLSGTRLARLRRETAWVDPAVQLWNRPLLENLAYCVAPGDYADLSRVLEAAELSDVLKKLPEGLQTFLGEGGGLMSGGEGQRVRLGRALMQSGVRLALLDEPFRGLDRRQRRELMEKTRHWWRGATLLCVTHDVEETLGFDRVLVVEGGGIVDGGCPGELAARPGRYRDLLETEISVREGLWRGDFWRRVRVEDGRVVAMPAERGTNP